MSFLPIICSNYDNYQCKIINKLTNKEVTIPHKDNKFGLCVKCKPDWDNQEPTVENITPAMQEYIEKIEKKEERDKYFKHDIVNDIINYTSSLINYAETGFKNVSEETYQSRLQICQSCENYDSGANKCKICGCRMAGESGFVSKLRMAHETCPLNPPKWGPEIHGENIPNQ